MLSMQNKNKITKNKNKIAASVAVGINTIYYVLQTTRV